MTGGPLAGLRVVELAGIGPGPHAAMQLSDLGADVVRVVRPDTPVDDLAPGLYTQRGRTSVVADLKRFDDQAMVVEMIGLSDVLIEGLRPGTTERLGLGPDDMTARNPRLVYARMTGWGQDGPLAHTAGHDINYISTTGALHAVGTEDAPLPPLNLVGDYGGGSMYLMVGILAALWERERSGKGQVVDAAMIDGVAGLLVPILELRSRGIWNDDRANNILDGYAPFYRTYRCLDGRYVAVGSIEPQFYALLVAGLGLDPAVLPNQNDRSAWPDLSRTFAAVFLTRTRDEWAEHFAGSDACVTPVLTFAEAPAHPQAVARGFLVDSAVGVTAAPAPRFSRSQPCWTSGPSGGTGTALDVVRRWTARTS
ncbi:CoA transferase [Actinomadura madurae]|uniref:CaiB/BaiF CoA transferase family protein n=1 Tax=Actinomadura madurae TaxID=1993 RepID=UPI00399A88E1